MTAKISPTLLAQLRDFVANHFGLHFPRERWHDLERMICVASQECGFQDIEVYVHEMLSFTLAQSQVEVLANHLTVGETYFFREKAALETIEQCIVPDIICARKASSDRELRIWSAGCATGEEPYSIAIILSRLFACLPDWKVTILATDLNARSLRRASEGTYGEWSFRGTPAWVRHTYFRAAAHGRRSLVPGIKTMVTFAYCNLADDDCPSVWGGTNAMDIILCRNVLMYFTPEAMKKAIDRFHRSLREGGWLIVSPIETSATLYSAFAGVSLAGTTLYQKRSTHAHMGPAHRLGGYDEAYTSAQFLNKPIDTMDHGKVLEGVQTGVEHELRSENNHLPAASYEQASYLHRQGRYEEAEQMLVALLSLDPGNAQAMLLLARSYANQGNLITALSWCDEAIASDKMAAPVHHLRAMILQEQGLFDEAILSLKRAIYVDPRFVLGHFGLGNLALRQGKLRESTKHFENTLLLLSWYAPEDIVPESDGLSVGELRTIMAQGGEKPGQPIGHGLGRSLQRQT
jgi:chemotaxis protein methyltransferase CheR